MKYAHALLYLPVAIFFAACTPAVPETVEMDSDTLYDKIRGAMVGQILGNLNGLPFEETYNDEPGEFVNYTPHLVPGGYTDDDTDIEWAYILYMEAGDTLLLQGDTIRKVWDRHMKTGIYASHQYARELMGIGIDPSLSGNIFVNPWASVNVAGQFACETFALTAPGMCRRAEEVALHYTSVVVDQEPLQSTQLFSAMISRAFVTDDTDDILQTGLSTLDKNGQTYGAVMDAIHWTEQYPDDWRVTRREIRKKYYFVNHWNKSVVNTASIVAQFIYGEGDFVKTMEIAFNWGFDADCNAATLGSVIGAMKGYDWFESQGWELGDLYCNKTRAGLPYDETISRFSRRILGLAEKNILSGGGAKREISGKTVYTIPLQKAVQLRSIEEEEVLFSRFQDKYAAQVMDYFSPGNEDTTALEANTYLAVALKVAEDIRVINPVKWEQGVNALRVCSDLLWCVNVAPEHAVKHMMNSLQIRFREPRPQLTGREKFFLEGYPQAARVYVVGTLNNWKAWKSPMAKTASGWQCSMDLPAGRYEYKIMIDGKAILDPHNPLQEVNGCDGTLNSVRIVR